MKAMILAAGEGTRLKPLPDTEHGRLANGGIYVLDKSIMAHIPPNCFYDFGHDVFPKLLEAGVPIYAYVLSNKEYLTDIGSWEHLQQAGEDVKLGRVSISI